MSSEEFLSSYNKINCIHRLIFDTIDTAVQLEEAEKPLDAIQQYKEAILMIDETLGLQISVPDDKDSVRTQWDEACKIIHKIKRTKAELLQRVGILTEKYKPVEVEKSICEDSFSQTKAKKITTVKFSNQEEESGRPRTYSELALELKSELVNESSKLELIFACDRVKFYNIKPNGSVTTNDESCTFRILRLEKDEVKKLNTTFFIQIAKSEIFVEIIAISDDEEAHTTQDESHHIVDEVVYPLISPKETVDARDNSSWIYPLIPCVSPCFHTEYGAFIFPDLEAEEYGTSFGIILPPDENTDEIVLEILKEILHGVVMQIKEGDRQRPTRDTSTQISENMVKGAQFISLNLIKGAEKTGEFINYSTPYIISKLQRATDDSHPVPSNVQTSVEVAKSVSGVVAGVTGYIAGKVGSSTLSLGKFLSPHIQKHGSILLSKTLGVAEREAQDKMQGVLTVAAGAVEGFRTIYTSLENSAKILGNNLSNNSVKIIEHKYGPSAGSLATKTFDTIGNVMDVSHNVNILTPKGVVKRTAKDTGKAIVDDYRPTTSSFTNSIEGKRVIAASSLYPELKGIEN
ncbi:SPG20 family protein [Megaselia abdita]